MCPLEPLFLYETLVVVVAAGMHKVSLLIPNDGFLFPSYSWTVGAHDGNQCNSVIMLGIHSSSDYVAEITPA